VAHLQGFSDAADGYFKLCCILNILCKWWHQ